MERKTVDIIIPAYKPGKEWSGLIEMLEKQTYPIRCIRVVNTEKQYWKKEYESRKLPMEVHHITRQEFDHGGTRNWAIEQSGADYVLCMTQDAMPADEKMVENLVKALEQEKGIAAAYGRQLPAKDCRLAERFTRQFNYPENSYVKWEKDIEKLGIKTFFCSNVCAMYDRMIYLNLGGFVRKTIFNEDMIYAGKAIQQGFGIAYAADACVIHSHNYSAIQQFHRNFDLAVSQADHPEVFENVSSEGEGIRLVKANAMWLAKQGKPWLILPLIWNSGWKYLGYLLGKRYRKLPKNFILWCTMNSSYWNTDSQK